jgi:putative transcriptional regulator
MSRHPVPDELLLDYAAGALPEGPALAVALHVALDPAAQRTVAGLHGIGGALLDGESGEEKSEGMGEAALQVVFDRLVGVPVEAAATVPIARPGFDWAPPPLRRYLGPGAKWKGMFGGFEEIRIDLHGDNHRASLLRLAPGKGLPVHRHVANEFTVVLQGGYTDNTGSYGVGDFAVGPGANEHEPIADPGEPCIALIIVEKPIVLTGAWGRLLNPFLHWGWM